MKIFVNYRRLDNAYGSGRIYDRLKYEFGFDNVIKDIDSIPLGKDFREYIKENIISSNVVITIIGQNWLTIKDENTGTRRIDGNNDYVRIELELAFENNVNVVPVFLDGLTNLDSKELPPSLEKLSFINGISIRPDPDFDKDIDRLVRRIKEFEFVKRIPASSAKNTPVSPPSEFVYNRETGSILLKNPIQLELIRIPEGECVTGRLDSLSIKDAFHYYFNSAYILTNWEARKRIHIKEFYIGKFPITNVQYGTFCRDRGYSLPPDWNDNLLKNRSNHPIVRISLSDARAFCSWLGWKTGWKIRLPTQDEWEKAARGTDARNYPWGDTFDSRKANFKESGINGTTSVDEYAPQGDSPYGVSDMAGNVWEWTNDYESYPKPLYTISEYPDQYFLKGGSFFRPHVPMYYRASAEIKSFATNFGFRIVMEKPG